MKKTTVAGLTLCATFTEFSPYPLHGDTIRVRVHLMPSGR